MNILGCRAEDLELLESHMPSPGLDRRYDARFDRQQLGFSSFLIAWFDELAVGSAEVLWRGCAAPEVTKTYPDCPELNGLQVRSSHQSRGIGTALVSAAEDLACERGCSHLGLGVADENCRAAQLYLRIGFAETGCHYLDRYHYLDGNGARHDVADPARFLIKLLPARRQ